MAHLRTASRVAVFAAIGLLAPAAARACSCVMNPGCGPTRMGDAMFVGKVLGVTTVPRQQDGYTVHERSFRIAVTESFSGAQRVGDELAILTGSGGGDCGYQFEVGSTYVVDAHRYGGELYTGICGSTQPLATAAQIVRELRTMVSGGSLPDLAGRTWTVQKGREWNNPTPLSGVTIVAQAKEAAETHRATTDSDGIYTFATLAPGTYQLTAELPPRMELTTRDDKPVLIAIPQTGGTGAACKVDLEASPTGKITGRILDAAGKPATEGWLYVYPAGESPETNRGMILPGPDGGFEADGLWDGAYVLQYEDVDRSEQHRLHRSFYPGAKATADGGSVTVQDGLTTGSIVFTLPEDF